MTKSTPLTAKTCPIIAQALQNPMGMSLSEQRLQVAIEAALEAGAFILSHAQRIDELNIEEKSARDFVSEVDKGAEKHIINHIKRHFADDDILAEETGQHVSQSTQLAQSQWIIDPLDGTTNFLHRNPHYAVSIGIVTNGVLTHGVVYDPSKQELFTGLKGQGAYLNSKRLQVSHQTRLEPALIATGLPFSKFDHQATVLAQLQWLMPTTAGVRRNGSAALDLAWVADGRFDAYWEYRLNAWDIAAGMLLVQEAGGQVSELDGGQAMLDSGTLLASNNHLHDTLRQNLHALDAVQTE